MIVGKTDSGGYRFEICIYYRFPQKSGNGYHIFMHNKHPVKGVYIYIFDISMHLRVKK